MDSEFETLVRVFGTLTLSLIAIVLPVFCGFSYGADMSNLIKFFLTMMTFGEAVLIWIFVWING